MSFLSKLFGRKKGQEQSMNPAVNKEQDYQPAVNKELISSAVAWMYGNRSLLNKGYSGEDPTFSKAKAKFLEGRGDLSPREKDELIKAFEEALKRV